MADLVPTAYKKCPQVLAVWTSLISVFCAGIHLGWIPLLPYLSGPSSSLQIDSGSQIFSFMITGTIGNILGNILSSLLVNTIGRKKTILLIGIPQLLSMIMLYLSDHSVVLVFAARFATGLSEGACFTVLPIYISEISEPRIRGFLGSSFSLFLALGVLFGFLLVSFSPIYITATIVFILSLIFLLCFSFMPESPYFLVLNNRREEAYACLKKLRNCQNVNEELSSLVEVVGQQKMEKGTFQELWTIKSIRKAFLVLVLLKIVEHFSGFILHSQFFFKNKEDILIMPYTSIIIAVVQVICTFIGTVLVDFIGRRILLLSSVGGCSVTAFIFAIFMSIQGNMYSLGNSDSSDWFLYILLLFFIASFSIGLGSVVNLLLGELFPITVIAKAICLINIVSVVVMLISAKIYQLLLDSAGYAGPFYVFGVFQLVGFVLCMKFLPETKKKSLEQIQQDLKK